MTVLYLQKMKGLELSLDGPTLAVRNEGQASRLYPLARLERLHLPATLDMDGQLLPRLTAAGVTVALCQRDGTPVAWCLPAQPEAKRRVTRSRTTPPGTLAAFVTNWRRRQLDTLLPALRCCLELPDDATQEDIHPAIDRILRRLTADGNEAKAARQWLTNEIRGRLLVLIKKHGLEPRPALSWAMLLGSLLELHLLPALISWLKQRHLKAINHNLPPPPLTPTAFMSFFETQHLTLDRAAGTILKRLEQWLEQARP